eukprot:13508235-Heterocapsa_arctica.AAC.1
MLYASTGTNTRASSSSSSSSSSICSPIPRPSRPALRGTWRPQIADTSPESAADTASFPTHFHTNN